MKTKTFMLLVLPYATSNPPSSVVTPTARLHTFMLNSEVCSLLANSKYSSPSFFEQVFETACVVRPANKWPKALLSILFSLKLKLVSGPCRNRLSLQPTQTEGMPVCQSGVMTYTQLVCRHPSSAVANYSPTPISRASAGKWPQRALLTQQLVGKDHSGCYPHEQAVSGGELR